MNICISAHPKGDNVRDTISPGVDTELYEDSSDTGVPNMLEYFGIELADTGFMIWVLVDVCL